MTPLTREQRTLAIGLVMGVTLVAFEMTAVITALPTISDELGGESLYGVALAAYTLADVVALVAAGELADRRGPTLPYALSLCTFVVGLIVAASAPTMGVIVLGRALQGAGTGGLAPIAYILVKRAFPEDRQGSMFAFLSAGWVLPSLVAPAFGGLITDHASWRWVFLCIVPFAVVVALLATTADARLRPVARCRTQDARADRSACGGRDRRFDVRGPGRPIGRRRGTVRRRRRGRVRRHCASCCRRGR